MKFLCNRRSDNRGAMIAIYCSMPWLFLSHSNAKPGQPWTLQTVLAVGLVLALALVSFFICRKRRNAA